MLPYDEWNAELEGKRVAFDWRPVLLVLAGLAVVAFAIGVMRL